MNAHPTQDINRLLEAWFNAETSLAEEQQLRAYFQQSNVAPEHKVYLPLFQAISLEKERVHSQPALHVRRFRPMRFLSAAAAVALLLSAGVWWWQSRDKVAHLAEQNVHSMVEPAQKDVAQLPPAPKPAQHKQPAQTQVKGKVKSRRATEIKPATPEVDPEQTIEEIKQALQLLSSKLNKSTSEARKTLKPLQQIDKTLNKVKVQES